MDRAERAKQFMPFAALKGYAKALRKKEEEVLVCQLHQGKRNDIITEEYLIEGIENYDLFDSSDNI